MLNSKNILLFVITIPLLLGGSCDKRKFSFEVNVSQIVTFENIEAERLEFETIIITTSDIKNNLDIPKDAKVTKVLIVGFGIKIIPKPENITETVHTFGAIKGTDGLRKILWDKQTSAANHASTYEHINTTVQEGVEKLKVILEEALILNKNTSYTLILEVDPGFNKFVADIKLNINVDVEYEQCIEVWDYLDAGSDCSF